MARSIKATREDVHRHWALTQAMGLMDLDVVKQEWDEAEGILFVYCIPRWGVDVCPECGVLATRVHDYPKQRHIHDAPLRGSKVMLVFDVHRLKCEHCGHVFTLRIRDVVDECTYTTRLAAEIGQPNRKQSIQTLADVYRIGYKTVESIVLKASEARLAGRSERPVAVKQLGIDEVSTRKGQGNYVLVITDLERRIVLDVLPDRQKTTLIAWLQDSPTGIDLSQMEAVAIDLWAPYRDAVAHVFGDEVHLVADRFHVMQNLHRAIHKARRQAQKAATTEEERKQLKGLRYVLLKNDKKLSDKDKQRLKALQATHPHLYKLTRLRQRLYEWYETDQSPTAATVALDVWLEDAQQLGCQALDVFCRTLRNWYTEIVNFFRTASLAASLKA